MNLSCFAAYVINLPDTTTITMIMIPHGILMMVILLAMTLTKLTLQKVSEESLQKNRLLVRTVPACRTRDKNCTVQNTMQSHYSGKARGQDTVHSTVPQTESLSYYLLSVERIYPHLKQITLHDFLRIFSSLLTASKAPSFYIRQPSTQSSTGLILQAQF